KAARGDVAAHGVEYRVAARHRPREVLRTIVDDGVRAEPAHVVVVVRARGADYARAEVLGELDREPGHASRAAVDQHSLACLDLLRILQPSHRRTERRRLVP